MVVNRIALTIALCVGTFFPYQAWAQSETSALAKNLLYYARQCDWQPTDFTATNSRIILVVLGDNPFENERAFFSTNLIVNHHIEFKPVKDAKDVPIRCHILFVSSSEKKRTAEILKPLKNQPTLTVSDIEDFTHEGGILSLCPKKWGPGDLKIYPELNRTAAQQAGLKLTAQFYDAVRQSQQLFK